MEDRGDTLVGSARSLPGFHAVQALDQVQDLLSAYGGHECAAGFKLNASHLQEFVRRLQSHATAQFQAAPLQSQFQVDCKLYPEDISNENIEQLQSFAPFGVGNPKALFLLEDVQILSMKPMGKEGEHLRFTVNQGGILTGAVAFRAAEHAASLAQATKLLVHLENNVWNGESRPQFQLVDASV